MTGQFLEGVRVVDLSRILAGPLASQILADMGAEVLKIEAPEGGDDTRAWGPPFQGQQSAYFQSCNRNKASLVLDLKREPDHQQLQQLLQQADIVVANMVPELRGRLRLSDEELAKSNPQLIAVHIVGFPGGTERENQRGYDLALQAESGWLALNGENDTPGYKVGVAVLDVLTANMAASAALAALYRRARTGEAHHVEVSLFQTALFSLVNVAHNHLASGEPTRRWGNAHPNIVPYQDFTCADRRIVIAVGNQRQFAALIDELKLPEHWSQVNSAERSRLRKALVSDIEDRVRTRPAAEVITRLRARHVPCAPILRADEALHQSPDSLVVLEHPMRGRVQSVANPVRSPGMRHEHKPPPDLGEGGQALAERWLGPERRAEH